MDIKTAQIIECNKLDKVYKAIFQVWFCFYCFLSDNETFSFSQMKLTSVIYCWVCKEERVLFLVALAF